MALVSSVVSKPYILRGFRNIIATSNNGYCTSASKDDNCPPGLASKRGLVLGVYEDENCDPVLTKAASKFNDLVSGKLMDLIKDAGPEVRKGQARVFNNLHPDYWSVAVAGIGPTKQGFNELEVIDDEKESVRVAAALGSLHLSAQGCNCCIVDGMGKPEQAAEGAALAVWRYQDNREDKKSIAALEIFDDADQDPWQRGLFKADSQNLVRKLADTPANQMTPLHFAQTAVNELCPCGIKVEVHDKDWIETKKMNAFLTVARGSCVPPLFVEITYCGGGPEAKHILMVGKGITYDSGGLCLRDCPTMSVRRADMTGGAVVLSVIRAASALSLPINITGLIPLCENMPSGMAMKVGDVIMGMNGKSIKIEDTANDGRLVMADAFVYGQTHHKPKLIIDVAGTSSGIAAALGSAATGVFTNSHTVWKEVRKAGIITGDRCWRMPLWRHFKDRVTRKRSIDVTNKGLGKGTPCLAAAFMHEFVNCVDWVHMDVEGTGMKCYDKVYPYYRKGRMTGRPTRTLIQLLYQLSCPNSEPDPCK